MTGLITIHSSYNLGMIEAKLDYAGGVLGYSRNELYGSRKIYNSYNNGSVTAKNENAGGIIGGSNSSHSEYCVSVSDQITATKFIGILIGKPGGSNPTRDISNDCYYNSALSTHGWRKFSKLEVKNVFWRNR